MSSPFPRLLLCSLLRPQWMVVFDPQDSHPGSTPGYTSQGAVFTVLAPGAGPQPQQRPLESNLWTLRTLDNFPLALPLPSAPWPKDVETLELGGWVGWARILPPLPLPCLHPSTDRS